MSVCQHVTVYNKIRQTVQLTSTSTLQLPQLNQLLYTLKQLEPHKLGWELFKKDVLCTKVTPFTKGITFKQKASLLNKRLRFRAQKRSISKGQHCDRLEFFLMDSTLKKNNGQNNRKNEEF